MTCAIREKLLDRPTPAKPSGLIYEDTGAAALLVYFAGKLN